VEDHNLERVNQAQGEIPILPLAACLENKRKDSVAGVGSVRLGRYVKFLHKIIAWSSELQLKGNLRRSRRE